MEWLSGQAGQERFEVRERLGEGGFGTVYAAWDRELGIPVAVKRLRQLSPDAIYRFKKEFRLLAEVAHPNLVSLYELFQADDAWYFTMELVPGRHMLEHLRPDMAPVAQAVTVPMMRGAHAAAAMPSPLPLPRLNTPVDVDVVRGLFSQLAQALCALHEAGLLHRDVKPSNVLVTPDRRVVVLDFGLATETRPLAAHLEGEIVGTPLYMSPEQWTAGPVTEASDWYSFGVVLYEALAGVPPFDGSPSQIGAALFERRPLRAHYVDPTVPEDLSRLCHDLLQIQPGDRPGGPEVLRRLLGARAPSQHTDRPRHVFVARAAELASLKQAFRDVAPGRPIVVELSGESGLGKTALCEHFLETLADDPEALILTGRSYEQETLPYRAFDGVIDELSRVLLRRWQTTAGAWPRSVGDLSRLFPVLGRVPGFQRSDDKDGRSVIEVRRNAVEALRELLRELGKEQSIVMLLDDVHWGDVDSAVLLHQLLAPPDAPPLLLLLTYRDQDAEASPFLRELRALGATTATAAETRLVPLERIAPKECEQLASRLLQRRRLKPEVLAELAREAAGNPLLLEELVRFTHANDGSFGDRAASTVTPDLAQRRALLEHMVKQRIDELPDSWRRFLAVVGLAARPIDVETAQRAADIAALDRVQLNRLRASHLLRTRHIDGREQVAPYHDRIREVVARALPSDERRALHLSLASALQTNKHVPAGLVAMHLSQAGELDRAADYALQAAAEAEAVLAFDEAAELYGKALEWRPTDRASLAKHAAALANAGRCADAAPRYVEAAAHAGGLDALLLKRRACEQYLMGGHSEPGLALLDELCAAVGLSRPKNARRATYAFAGDFLRLKLRGLDYRERAEADIDPMQLYRIDLCISASRQHTLREPITATRMSGRGLLLALDAGEPTRIVECLAALGSGLTVFGSPFGQEMLVRARAIADRLGTPYVLGLLRFWTAFVDHTHGRWNEALATWEEAAKLLRQCRGVQSEIQKADLNVLLDLQLLGRFEELSRRAERAFNDARATGNRYSEVYARLYSAIPPLAAGDAKQARARIDESLARAPAGDYFIRTTSLKFESYVDLYRGEPAEGLARLEAAWPMLEAARLMRSGNFRLVFCGLRAGLAMAARGDSPKALDAAEDDIGKCASAKYPYAVGQTAMLRAALATRRGRREQALAEVEQALHAFADASLELESAYARRRKGQLLGGDTGRALIDEAEALMRRRGIAEPTRWVRTQAPGFPEVLGVSHAVRAVALGLAARQVLVAGGAKRGARAVHSAG